ncbi:Lrp/AsnC family transcriptional regulator [Prauserella muralis]|uniref:AsnC family transcriptional regulator n=1 Tax=Prauserella muralis TaxID=588067 RepID=A0A2V4AGG9_9PSEU|nr:Lrp/AsnC family transcriptional regulator [Prauserella muralis]PXY18801.1 AsnC family transcriptional regulator [Prauserella muralis]TWE28651.1 DNA-binding Lrp family transcriptional regulator [Prauserella muralis]
MTHGGTVDPTDARILLELTEHPRATTLALADRVGISRNTAQARLARMERDTLASFERRVPPAVLGYPLTAFITAAVTQRRLDEVAAALATVPEVLEVHGISGPVDLMIHVVARDADDLYRVAGRILAIPGVERTNTALVMRQLVDYRITPLLRQEAEPGEADATSE